MKFGHIGIKVLDMEKSLKFYESVLSANVLQNPLKAAGESGGRQHPAAY